MPTGENRTVKVSAQHSAFIDAQVASGAFASAEEVVSAGINALHGRDMDVARWLREEIAPSYHEMQAHPECGVSLDEVVQEIHARHAAQT